MQSVKWMAALAVLLLGVVAPASAEEWKKDYAVGAKPQVQVQTNDASIEVHAVPGNTISARVTTNRYNIGNDGVRITEFQSGDRVSINVKVPSRHFGVVIGNGRSVRIEVTVPASASVALTSSDGSLTVAGVRGPLSLTTSDGSIRADDAEGTLAARTSDGSIHVSGRFDALDLATSDGSIHCDARPGSRINGPWNVRTSDGSVTLRIPGDLAADLEAWTSDGRVTLNMPITVEGVQSRNRIRGKLNGGGSQFKVHTSDGSITIDRF